MSRCVPSTPSITVPGPRQPRAPPRLLPKLVLAKHALSPADLGPGDSYRLLHVTSDTRAATGTGIHKYHDSVGSDPILLVDPAGLMDEWGGIFLHQRALVSHAGR